MSAPSAPSAPHLALRIALVIAAALELFGALLELPELAARWNVAPDLRPYPAAVDARVALAPIAAILAFGLTFAGRLRGAIAALAALILIKWLAALALLLPSGVALPPGYGATAFIRSVVYPAMAAAALALLLRGRSPALAGTLVILPTALVVIAFASLYVYARIAG